jgi:hypothetical protein
LTLAIDASASAIDASTSPGHDKSADRSLKRWRSLIDARPKGAPAIGDRRSMDIDADSRRMNVRAGPVAVIAVLIVMIANDHGRIRVIDTLRNAGAIVADLPAHLVGIGGVREREPHGGGRDANQNLTHG